ncbi:MAG: DUF3783 domain-containing protein [Dysosmobacter sp.]|nr:DUF3783 domain-containing protein [Dysosmobacter sp.]
MSGKLLLFGFDTLPAILAVEAAAGPLGAEIVPVARTDYNKTLAVLAGLDTAPGPAQPYAGGTLGGRMIVLCGMDDQLDALLSALAGAGVGPDCLKAVLTPHNRTWNAVTLYTELARERRAIQGR